MEEPDLPGPVQIPLSFYKPRSDDWHRTEGQQGESKVLWMSAFQLTQFQDVHPRLKIIKLQDIFWEYCRFDSALIPLIQFDSFLNFDAPLSGIVALWLI